MWEDYDDDAEVLAATLRQSCRVIILFITARGELYMEIRDFMAQYERSWWICI